MAEPLLRQIAIGVPHVLGWDGSVYDADAVAFAEDLYAGLSRGETVAFAAAKARHAVMDPAVRGAPGQHWHLARVYLGPGGGGKLCDKAQTARPTTPPAAKRFLDAQMQVPQVRSPGKTNLSAVAARCSACAADSQERRPGR